jgi:hypothetical protein
MHYSTRTESNGRSIAILFALAILTTLFVIPTFFVSEAGNGKKNGPAAQTASHDDDLPNYDIRTDKQAYGKLAGFRSARNLNAAAVADIRESFVRGEESLKTRVPSIKIEYNSDLRIPEVIAPDVSQGRNLLTRAATGKRSDVLSNFLRENNELLGLRDDQIASLKVAADYTNPDGNLSFVELNQEINGIPVFRGEVKAGFTKNGEIVRVINNLAPGVDESSVSQEFGDPAVAVNFASVNVKYKFRDTDLSLNKEASTDLKAVFGKGDWGATAEKMYFPTEPGIAVPAWRVMIAGGIATYYVIVDAESGTMLWRKNLTEDQTQSATYNVYVNPNAMVNVADNPFPLTPGPINPGLGTQGAAISRTQMTLVGNEAPYTFNNLGWITDGGNTTDGNNVQAGLDRKLPNVGNPANPADLDPDGVAVGNPNRVFDFAFTPGNPNTNSGDSPLPAGQSPNICLAQANTDLPTDYQKAITTQLFYIVNRYHDEMYLLGFTEAARNFQNTNFSGQGVGNDRVAAQAQDCSGRNNANFTTPADGNRPTMQMYLWDGPTPDFDGSLDADVVIHEHTHGLSNRLHGNSSGLSTNMARGMGEGWSDFYGHSMLSEPTDPIVGIYTTGGYATYNAALGFTANYYYGIRRYPKAVMSFTGGVNNKPHNAYTFSYLNSNCNTRLNNTNFAFGRGVFGSATCDQVHNIGEIWSTALWEVRAKFIERLGWTVGNRRMLQLVTDGMKLAPLGPTMLQERDAIIAAAVGSGDDVADIWAGFAIRGMGFSASIQNVGSGANNTVVTDGFDTQNLFQTPQFTVSDAAGNNNGFPEPGEPITLTIPLTNTTGSPATGVTLQVVGGGSANYGTIAHGATVSQNVSFTVPPGTPCGSVVNLTFNVNSSLGATSFQRTMLIGSPIVTFTENFDGVTAPAFPAGWTAVPVSNGINFVTFTTNSDTPPNAAFALDPTNVGGGSDLTSPSIPITAPAATVTFRNRFDTEGGWDGGVLEISIGGGPFQDIIAAGGSFIQNGYNGILGLNPTGNSPLGGRNAWSGNSAGYITTVASLPPSAAGQNVQLRWRFGADDNTTGIGPSPGWYIDGISVAGNYACNYTPPPAGNVRADFDGDGRTDLSVFRPSEGVWYIDGSTQGFIGYYWGTNGDIPVPADYDQDGKTDAAVFRPGDNTNSLFYVLKSNGFVFSVAQWGFTGDIPIVRDYDGDDIPDYAVYRPDSSVWYISGSLGGLSIFQYGNPGDVPVAGDFDGDGIGDPTVFRNGVWITQGSSGGGVSSSNWGLNSDKLVPADYDGDGKDDLAVYRPSNGTWWVVRSSDGSLDVTQWGADGDIPVPGNYDSDSFADRAVYRNGVWWVLKSTGGFSTGGFGINGDKPIPAAYLP